MMMRVLQRVLPLVVAVAQVSSSPLPEKSPALEFGGFQPVHGARGTGPASGYGAPPLVPEYVPPPLLPEYGVPPLSSGYGAPGGVGDGHAKTIFVNVPHPEPIKPLPPIAAGPPRKHYKIVFIRAPPPQPPPQPILPPRTEQKTLIYVLHQRPQVQEQKVINLPQVQHDPEVYFVQYDNPPSAEELQQLSAGNLEGYSIATQRTGHSADIGSLPLATDGAELDAGLGLGAARGALSSLSPGSGIGGGGDGHSLPGLVGAAVGHKISSLSSGGGIGGGGSHASTVNAAVNHKISSLHGGGIGGGGSLASTVGAAVDHKISTLSGDNTGLGGSGHGSLLSGSLGNLKGNLVRHLASSSILGDSEPFFRPLTKLSSDRDIDNSFENRVGVAGKELTQLPTRT
ncbi:uncharacterized protein [Cherax quadricarinatus]|uniref:uncharacterized protein n=1 Tax=Cherax quadricarinatus TaxID=27406 RepID=UPI002379A93F|nr:uncharacterized protein LOC128693521 [Cherax quadricarinatus]